MEKQVNIRTIIPENIHSRAKILAVKRKVDLQDLIPELIKLGLEQLEPEKLEGESPEFSTAKSLKRFLGTWKGNDADEVLKRIAESRTKAEF